MEVCARELYSINRNTIARLHYSQNYAILSKCMILLEMKKGTIAKKKNEKKGGWHGWNVDGQGC